jgi:hypothetical protein
VGEGEDLQTIFSTEIPTFFLDVDLLLIRMKAKLSLLPFRAPRDEACKDIVMGVPSLENCSLLEAR